MSQIAQETHPLKPFLPDGARLVMLGTFPPSRKRWSMDFFYPNFQNDMWRIFGSVFLNDRAAFEVSGQKRFDADKIAAFLTSKKIGVYDTADKIARPDATASDNSIEILSVVDFAALFARVPLCRVVAATGAKAAEIFAEFAAIEVPPMGECAEFKLSGRKTMFYRMPSSSRAYPLAFEKKCGFYAKMFSEGGFI